MASGRTNLQFVNSLIRLRLLYFKLVIKSCGVVTRQSFRSLDGRVTASSIESTSNDLHALSRHLQEQGRQASREDQEENMDGVAANKSNALLARVPTKILSQYHPRIET